MQETFVPQGLGEQYRSSQVVLYTGAGVSTSIRSGLGLPCWNDLLVAVARAGGKASLAREAVERINGEWMNQPWEAAEWITAQLPGHVYADTIAALVRHPKNFQPRNVHGQLSGGFLSAAPTLNAVTAFCASLAGILRGTAAPTLRLGPNPRVRAIVTSNYDPYLEAAAVTKYRRRLLKPVAAFGSSAGQLGEIPVFHVHGYVQMPSRRRGPTPEPRRAFVDPVLSGSDYRRAWRSSNAYSHVIGSQVHLLRHYPTLFIGFSFRDGWINGLLRRLHKERTGRCNPLTHYAVISEQELDSKRPGFFDELGVQPLVVRDFSQLPQALGELYMEGLRVDSGGEDLELPVVARGRGAINAALYGRRTDDPPLEVPPQRCWEILLACRNSSVPAKLVRATNAGP